MTAARYGALGVLNEERNALAQFLTVGLAPDQERAIGPRPTGKGLLGLLITDPQPVRVGVIAEHPASSGFPANHPPMTSFLGVPIKVRDEVYGNLYLTDKIGWAEFTADDQALVGALAVAAGVAIENARLHQLARQVAVFEDRDRLARDLHDTIIQRLFALGLTLQSMAAMAAAAGMGPRLTSAVTEIDETIRQLRSIIYELGLAETDQGLRAGVVVLVRELEPVIGLTVPVTFDGPIDTALSEELGEHLLATIREALTNVGRHAQASRATVNLTVSDGHCHLQIDDDGRGLGHTDTKGGGLGLVNLRRRAEKLHGTLVVESAEAGGTLLVWEVPIVQ